MKEQALRSDGAEAEKLFSQARDAYDDSLDVCTIELDPHGHAETQTNLAILHSQWSQRACCTDPAAHLADVLAHVDAALTIFHPEHSSYHHAWATSLRERILAAQEALSD